MADKRGSDVIPRLTEDVKTMHLDKPTVQCLVRSCRVHLGELIYGSCPERSLHRVSERVNCKFLKASQ